MKKFDLSKVITYYLFKYKSWENFIHIKKKEENLERRICIYINRPNFSDSEIKHFGFFPSSLPTWIYLARNPNFIDLDNIP